SSNLGAMAVEAEEFESALRYLEKALENEPNLAGAHYNLGITFQELGRLDEAEASYTKAIALKPDFAEAYSTLGNTHKELGRLDEAEASYNQAIALKPDYADALYNRSLLLFDKAEYESSLRDAEACILKKARVLPLVSLYALGRIDEIYQRIEVQSKVDGEDISIAAFAAFISEVEKKPTEYNFCPHPIDFVHVSNLSSHVSESGAYVAGVIEELNKIETIWEPSGKSTVGGFQSLVSVNLFESPSGKIAELKSIIITELKAYYLRFQNEPCSYIQRFPSKNILRGWNVILKHEGHQNAHIHPDGWLSGVIYLKVVPSLGKDEGAIEFSLNGRNYYDVNSTKLTLQPEAGDIVFFPSSLHHRTIPFTTYADRIIVSFDLMPETAKHQAARLT
ncbi:tetratricopeptide repeat protein, partial [Luminiphilus sp.]|nr:tetratricopeptide repeat protein [Luminiphilus sp.]